jgi:hypothetical protein
MSLACGAEIARHLGVNTSSIISFGKKTGAEKKALCESTCHIFYMRSRANREQTEPNFLGMA